MAGLYQLHKLRELWLKVRGYEAGSTWYWNRRPGARFDSQAEAYQYWFSEELYKAWQPSERFPGQPETERWLNSVMAGLACGETSPLAWRFLQPAVDVFMTVSDAQAAEAMRVLAEGRHGDIPVVAGESGVAGLAGLQALMAQPSWSETAGLDATALVLLLNTEGATAPSV